MWSDPDTLLAARTATAIEDVRFFLAARWINGATPPEYFPAAYGPQRELPDKPREKSPAELKAEADELRREMGLAVT